MKNLTWQNPEQLFVAQELINKVKSKCCGIKDTIKQNTTDKIRCASLLFYDEKSDVKREVQIIQGGKNRIEGGKLSYS